MDKKEDRRIVMTKRMLKEALLTMLKDKDIYHVSIRELCDNADINRTTFYKYYGSQIDLLSEIEDDMIAFMTQIVKQNEGDTKKIIIATCEFLEENLEFARLMINNNVDPDFPNRVLSTNIFKEASSNKLSSKICEAEKEYMYNFITYGILRIISIWINKEKRESPEEIANLVDLMVHTD